MYNQLYNIIAHIQKTLVKTQANYILKRENEKDLSSFNLTFKIPEKKKIISHIQTSPKTHIKNCTLCDRRISYKYKQFHMEKPLLPVLILIHNNFHGDHNRYYQNEKENVLFKSLIKENLGIGTESFLVRETLRCHFSSEDVYNSDWFEHCKTHIETDIQKYNIQSILVIGEAIKILFPNNKEILNKINQKIALFNLPTILVMGPSRIVFMKEKQFATNKIEQELQSIKSGLLEFKQLITSYLN